MSMKVNIKTEQQAHSWLCKEGTILPLADEVSGAIKWRISGHRLA